MLSALLASSCCVIPLVLVGIGLSGAWIGNLTRLEPYSGIFAGIALLCIGLGFWQVYFRQAGACATKRSVMVTKAVLWLAAILTLIALTTSWWAPLFY
jgi:mercuric ion transport protein